METAIEMLPKELQQKLFIDIVKRTPLTPPILEKLLRHYIQKEVISDTYIRFRVFSLQPGLKLWFIRNSEKIVIEIDSFKYEHLDGNTIRAITGVYPAYPKVGIYLNWLNYYNMLGRSEKIEIYDRTMVSFYYKNLYISLSSIDNLYLEVDNESEQYIRFLQRVFLHL